jgi:hypothetical protein
MKISRAIYHFWELPIENIEELRPQGLLVHFKYAHKPHAPALRDLRQDTEKALAVTVQLPAAECEKKYIREL